MSSTAGLHWWMTYGDVGELSEPFELGEDCAGAGCRLASLRTGAYSLKDFSFFLLCALPARCEKLSRYDLFFVEVNIFSMRRP